MGTSPWTVSDELWERIEPLLPRRERRFRCPGRRPLSDRQVLCGILYVLRTGTQSEYLPQEAVAGASVHQALEELDLRGGAFGAAVVPRAAVLRHQRHTPPA